MAEDYSEYRRRDVTPELVKQTVTVYDVASMLDLEVNSSNKIVSPYNPEDRTPSCHLYEDHFWDFSTGRGGDIFDFVQAFEPDMKFQDIIWQLWTKALRSGREPGDVERSQPRELVEFAYQLPPFRSVCFAGIDLHQFDIRMTEDGSEVWVPHAQNGDPNVYGVKIRYANGQKTSLPGSQFGHKLYSPVGWDPHFMMRRGECVITEGESDSWAIWGAAQAAALDVFALPSGASAWKDHWMQDLESYSRIWLAFDNDRAGKAAFDKIIRKIGWDRGKELKVPGLYGDVREAVAAGWEPTW